MRIAIFITILLVTTAALADWDDILEQNKKQYPACVEVTKSKLEGFSEEIKSVFADEIFEACVEGRKIGEEKAEKPVTKKKKEKLNIKVVPPGEGREE